MQTLNPGFAPAATAMTQAAAPVGTPATAEVVQVAAPAGFNVMQFAVHKAKAESSNSRTPVWECGVEELRSRVTFRDVQAVSNRNPNEYHLRPFLSPKSLPMEEVLGKDAAGNDINTIIVEAQYADAAKQQFLDMVVAPGHMDAVLLRVAQEIHQSKLERDAAPKKAPVDAAAGDAALADLEAMNAGGVPAMAPAMVAPAGIPQAAPVAAAPVAAAPAGIPQAMPAGVAVAQAAPVAQQAPMGLPAGMPAGIPPLG